MRPRTHKNFRPGFTPGFTLLEIILVLVVGMLLTALLVQMGYQAAEATRAMRMVNLEFETIREAERVTAKYRKRIEENALNLDSLLNSWTADDGVTMDSDPITVHSTDGGYTFRYATIRRVTLTKDGQTMAAYFTE
ncbi:type II secretion system protein [Desulfocurvus sp. DL9XJH121]